MNFTLGIGKELMPSCEKGKKYKVSEGERYFKKEEST